MERIEEIRARLKALPPVPLAQLWSGAVDLGEDGRLPSLTLKIEPFKFDPLAVLAVVKHADTDLNFLLSEVQRVKSLESRAVPFALNEGGPTQIGVFEVAVYEKYYLEKWGWYWELLFTGYTGGNMITVAKCKSVCETQSQANDEAESALLKACGVNQ